LADRIEDDFTEYSEGDLLSESPLVSVLVLSYNHAPYLPDAIESILKQHTSFPFEIIIGDDASTDNSLAVALDYQRRHPSVVRVLRSAANAGMHANHRRLIGAARGEYLAYCEGDDYWNPVDKLERQLVQLIEDPTVGLVHSEFSHIRRLEGDWQSLPRYWREHRVAVPEGDIFDPLCVSNFVQTCTMVLRTGLARDFLESGLPIETYLVADWALALFVAAKSNVAYIEEPLATYRQVPGSATNSGALADIIRARDSLRMVDDIRGLVGREGRALDVVRRATVERTVLVTALRGGLLHEARDAFASLLAESPSTLSRVQRFGTRLVTVSSPTLAAYARLSGRARLRRAALAYDHSPHDPAA
jgi:hypothetical protein